jgi:hypothetical protein
MATARATIIPPGSPGYYHCVSRCVRRSFICGFDKLIGKNFQPGHFMNVRSEAVEGASWCGPRSVWQ